MVFDKHSLLLRQCVFVGGLVGGKEKAPQLDAEELKKLKLLLEKL